MRIAVLVAAASASIGLGVTAAMAQVSGQLADPAAGREVAERLCSNCHAVAANSQSARGDVPPFGTIARLPDQTAERLAGKIIVPHPAMPSVQLTLDEIRNVVAYILSLRDGK